MTETKIRSVKMGGGFKLPLPGIQYSSQDSWVALKMSGELSHEDLIKLANETVKEISTYLRQLLEAEGISIIEEIVEKRVADKQKEFEEKLELARTEYKKLLIKLNGK